MARQSKAMRTKKGTVTEKARSKSGMKGRGKQGKFPVFDVKSAMSAIQLRHHGKGVTPEAVLNKVARWARAHGKPAVLEAVRAARARDKERKKGK